MNRIYNPRGHQLILTLNKKDIEEIIAKEISGKLEISEDRIKTEVKVSVGEIIGEVVCEAFRP